MGYLFLAFKIWVVTVIVSFIGMGMIIVWDWFFYRRLPYARWRTSQLSPKEARLLRELVRVRRLKERKELTVATPVASMPTSGATA